MKWPGLASLVAMIFLASSPASTNYTLQSYGVGTGGTANSSSSNYRANGLTGEQAGSLSSTNYKAGAGVNYTIQANVPTLTLTNTDNWYDKLTLVLNRQGNASDAKFAVAISTDNFVTTKYVKNDFTITPALTAGDYLTYAGWGGASGVVLRGLAPSTTYAVKAEAIHGAFTETGLGPAAVASTVNMQISFRIDVAPTYTNTSPPYVVNMGSLIAGTVVTASDKIWTTLSTNANNGAFIYGNGQYGGLSSTAVGHTIVSSSVDLSTVAEGFGEQGVSATQASGGPLTMNATYNVTGTNVGQDYPKLGEMFTTSGMPISAGVGEVAVMGKAGSLTPAAVDYAETLTLVAAGSF